MSEVTPPVPADQAARDRFRDEWRQNFAVSANAGSGKTTAISERLAAMALDPAAAGLLRRTAVVTFTRKAATQIGQRARTVLLQRLAASGGGDLAPLDQLERAFFGTIHSFCLLLAQRHGQALGLNLNPAVVEGEEAAVALWEEFLEQDAMEFTALSPAQVRAFLRHAPLESVFELAGELERAKAEQLVAQRPGGLPPAPAPGALDRILAASCRAGRGAEALRRNQQRAQEWARRLAAETGYLPLPQPEGTAGGIKELYAEFLAPVKGWLAAAGATLAGELALRYRAWRFDRGVQTYADQVEAALAVLQDRVTLDRIRADGWRILLDEAQDTDPQQFAVLVEVARPPGAPLRTWPDGGGLPPRPGHFCLVGDGQQSIYSSRADVRNFLRHVGAFARGDGGEQLKFAVTFRTPQRLVALLNETLAPAFGPGRDHNLGLPPAEGAPAPFLQVEYEPLAAGPRNAEGTVAAWSLVPAPAKTKVDHVLAAEVRQIAARLRAGGPAAVGARHWGEICLLAPRNGWLLVARRELEAAGLQTALQMRRNRSGDHPAYAWTAGLLAAVCDPADTFEWTGVLREIFAVGDDLLAAEIRAAGRYHWDAPDLHPEPLRSALATLRPFVLRVDAEAAPLEQFAHDLVAATGLARKARALDPGGGLNAELERLVAQAAQLGLEGAGPRAWRDALLADLETGRPSGKPSEEAISLLTAHSAKGLEWPVVIPLGLWRPIGWPPPRGLRVVTDAAGGLRVLLDEASMPEETLTSHNRERSRELVRLLYVTLTRARRGLVLPRGEPARAGSFLDLWGADLAALPEVDAVMGEAPGESPAAASPVPPPPAREPAVAAPGAPLPVPRRVLPHELAVKPDVVRRAMHEAGEGEPRSREEADPLEYGTWWHETMEFLPWTGEPGPREEHLAARLAAARHGGFAGRADEELAQLRKTEAWAELTSARWRVLTEVSIVAPLGPDAWVDGVIDLVAHDPAREELLVVDWKTNRPREGESPAQVLARLRAEYEAQVDAYRSCLQGFFPGAKVRVALYATAVGAWTCW